MKRRWLTALAGILFVGSIIWWSMERDQKDNWLLLLVLSLAVGAFTRWLGGRKKGLERDSGPPKQ